MSGFTLLHGLILVCSIQPLVSAEKPDDGCGHYVLGQESGVLSSKNYPGTYPNNSWCEWRIRVPIGHTIILKFGDLNMEEKDCGSDYLEVLKGSYGAETVEWKYCGGPASMPTLIHIESSELTVRFRSSQHISGRGFLLSYSIDNNKELLTCLDRDSHFQAVQTKYRKYCPAGCAAVTGDVSGDISLGYRHTSVLCKAAVHAGVIMDQFGGPITVEESRGLSHYPAVRANGIQSKDGSLSEAFTFVTNDCDKQSVLQMVTTFTSSSWHNITSDGSEVEWFPNNTHPSISEDPAEVNNSPQWLQIDLGEKRRITGILTTGLTIANLEYFVKNYKIEYKERNRWRVFTQYNSSSDMIFEGNADSFHQTRNTFHPSIATRFIRLVPQQWHRIMAMRVQLLGCPYIKPAPVNSSQVTQEALPTQPIQNMTKPVPSQADLVHLIVIIVPIVLLVVLLLVGICVVKMLYSKKTKENTYGSADAHHTGCWRQIKQPFARHQSTEFTIKYNTEKDPIQKLDLVTSAMAAEYQQPLMLGTDTVSRKGSTFRPMDTDAKDKDIEATSHYDRLQTGIQYALPLTNQEPEYATPIIERHAFRKDPFITDPSYSVPGAVLNKSPSFRAMEGNNCRKVIGGLAGSYQMPQVKKDGGKCLEGIYDSPKIRKSVRQNGNLEYQRPQIKAPVHECYSTPRDCVRLAISGPRPDPEGSRSDPEGSSSDGT